ncbi:para-aminobenzoate synthase [Guyanagaster necrorhizus]|uniref:aminodeoxychorismate synthase n=1 Tax=Guyanagaster necrorhizus TaxID=856835 RepID=A0A9P7W2T4_9AGAR|nr:para-aminobenzoate synthase [Guyanagaster necrorhizus MCA 3950]KAG7452311.1 para-aminobenzoate synthase [Guyanagaster necrorhizus MCA 3950]
MTFDPPRLLLIDSYDSFTFNLASLFRRSIPGCCIHILKNDRLSISDLLPHLRHFSAIVVGPGPGSPDNTEDIGLVRDLWNVSEQYMLPIFGVCLGLQSLALADGAELHRLPIVKHGQISHVVHTGHSLFEGVGRVEAVRYHSLHVTLLPGGSIEPLAWADDEPENGRIVMAIEHRTWPFWAVQYHPESACTAGGGPEVVANFWRLAQQWTHKHGRKTSPWCESARRVFGPSWPHASPLHQSLRYSFPPALSVNTIVVDAPTISVTNICDILGANDEQQPFVLLDSAARPGRFSIIASMLPTSLQITYNVDDPFVGLARGTAVTYEKLGDHNIWSWLASFMYTRKAGGGRPEIPFWGGLIGLLSYEVGVCSLGVAPRSRNDPNRKHPHPDVNFAFIERSIVVDNLTGKIYVQSIIPNDDTWLVETSVLVQEQPDAVHQECLPLHDQETVSHATVILPDKDRYISNIKQAMDHLFRGNSYELCLTAHTRIQTSSKSSWNRYKTLRRTNPAPHSAFLRLSPTTFLSSSPERFLSFSRPPDAIYQLRPIKGTIRKGPDVDRAYAERALAGSPKEVAENLMIVDLIRHDLHSVVGEGVTVQQFCAVEEYETVWQLVSVIEGQSSSEKSSGWDVLRSSLPPGSMTGAPKKRSVEILQDLEESDRSLYSGVFGYWCVGGGGDWAVTIRSAFRHDDPNVQPADEKWVVGAGGAITALSDPESEWDEMVIKLQSVLRTFD